VLKTRTPGGDAGFSFPQTNISPMMRFAFSNPLLSDPNLEFSSTF
jgi:hypothetical protein